jgi:hypothetical protein
MMSALKYAVEDGDTTRSGIVFLDVELTLEKWVSHEVNGI